MYRYIIIDDEHLSVNILENHLEKNTEYTCVGVFSSPYYAIDVITKGKVDLVFISFSSSSGNIIDLIQTLNTELFPLFVVVSSNKMDVFRVNSTLNVVDFLEKPIYDVQLTNVLRKVQHQISIRRTTTTSIETGKDYLFIKVDKKKVRLNFDDILYVESIRDYVKIFTENDDYLVYSTLTNFTKGLPESSFMRVHRSYTISLSKVHAMEGNTVEIAGVKVPFSRKYLDVIKEKLVIDGE